MITIKNKDFDSGYNPFSLFGSIFGGSMMGNTTNDANNLLQTVNAFKNSNYLNPNEKAVSGAFRTMLDTRTKEEKYQDLVNGINNDPSAFGGLNRRTGTIIDADGKKRKVILTDRLTVDGKKSQQVDPEYTKLYNESQSLDAEHSKLWKVAHPFMSAKAKRYDRGIEGAVTSGDKELLKHYTNLKKQALGFGDQEQSSATSATSPLKNAFDHVKNAYNYVKDKKEQSDLVDPYYKMINSGEVKDTAELRKRFGKDAVVAYEVYKNSLSEKDQKLHANKLERRKISDAKEAEYTKNREKLEAEQARQEGYEKRRAEAKAAREEKKQNAQNTQTNQNTADQGQAKQPEQASSRSTDTDNQSAQYDKMWEDEEYKGFEASEIDNFVSFSLNPKKLSSLSKDDPEYNKLLTAMILNRGITCLGTLMQLQNTKVEEPEVLVI